MAKAATTKKADAAAGKAGRVAQVIGDVVDVHFDGELPKILNALETQNGDNNIYRTTADVQWEATNGLSAYAAVNGNFTDLGTVGAGDDSRFDWGALAQVGYLLNPSWEVFGRYDVVALDSDFVAGEDTFNEFTVGVNYFLGASGSYFHKAKFTFDLVYLPEGSPSNQTGTGVLANSGDEEIVFRGQFQLLL